MYQRRRRKRGKETLNCLLLEIKESFNPLDLAYRKGMHGGLFLRIYRKLSERGNLFVGNI